MRRRLYVLTKIFLITAMSAIFTLPAYSATCTVTTGTTHQTIRGFGASNAWSDCGSCVPGSAKNAWFTPANLDMLFTTNGNGIGLSIIRMRIPPDAGQFGSAIAPVQGAVARGAIVMASEWTPPPQWKNVNTTNNQNGEYLLPANYQNYANYLRDFVNTMNTTYGVTIDTLSPANEPDYQVSYDGCTWSGAQLNTFLRDNLGPTFAAAGLATKLSVGESFANTLGITDPSLNDAATRNYLDVVSVHTYGGGPTAYPLCQTHGKDYWMTERSSFEAYDPTMTHAMTVAGWLHGGMVTAEYNAWLYWWLSSDANNEGITHPTLGNPKRFYVIGNYSKFVRPGFVRIETSAPGGGINCSAYRNTGSTSFVFIATNTNASAQSLTYSIPGIGLTSVTPYVTDASNDLAAQAAVAVSGNSFTFNLPARSVVSFVGNMPAGTPTRTRTNTPYAGTPTFTATPSSTPNSIMLDDMEDGNNQNNWGGDWYSYSGTGTTITPKPFVMTAGGMTGSTNYRASIIATVADYAGLGTNLNAAGTGVDLTSYIAVEFWVRGNGGSYWFHFTQADITSGDYYGVAFTAPATWTKVTVNIDQASLGKRGFGSETGPFAENAVVALQWTSNGNGALDIQVDNVQFLTSVAMSPTRTPSRTPTVAVPSPTYTRTRTYTPANTATYTRTRTSTAVNTATSSPVNTATFTRTNTPVNTVTYTFTRTSTAVNTATYTRTRTNTAVNTVTFTRTNTPVNTATQTQTYTASRTPSPSFTMTITITNTPFLTFTRTNSPTMTITSNLSPTFTFTRTVTNTPAVSPTSTPTGIQPTSTFTPSYTATLTRTNSPSMTITITNTPVLTFTRTYSPTMTITSNLSPTFTPTRTLTSTPVSTASNTPVNTATVTTAASFTMTITITNTLTLTFTRTATPSRTQTLTRTGTPTRTESPDYSPTETYTGTPPTSTRTPTITQTETEIPTDTELPTDTATPANTITRTSTVTSTRTVTPLNTITVTPSVTATLTLTLTSYLTFTYTATSVSSPSNTPTRTQTASVTATNTPVNTVTGTGTPTLTLTLTLTYTFTRTSTPVNTATMTWTLTSVATPTATIAWENTFKIESVLAHPNPYRPGSGNLSVNIGITKQATELKLRIYTASFRCVLELDGGSANTRDAVITIPRYKLGRLSSGTYYVVVTGKSGNERVASMPSILIIIR